MFQKILHRIIVKRHYWRTVGFSELAELYASRLLRLMAVNIVGGVAGIYMYQLGYPVWQILFTFSIYFAMRSVTTIPSAYFIARVGPKHAILVSNILYVPVMFTMAQLEGLGIYALAVFCLVQPLAVTMYSIAHHTTFSKVKHSEHSGKELSFMYIVEKLGAGLSPLVGGLIAFAFGPVATMWAACALFIVSAGPLFFSPEAVSTRQKITFRGFNWRGTYRNLIAAVGIGIDQALSFGLWSLFVAIAIFGTASNVVYAQIGGLLSVSVIASLFFSRLYGAIVDRREGGMLLRVTGVGNAVLHVFRAFISTPTGVVLVNVVNEATTTGYAMPFLKGQYDMADSLPGYRIVYTAIVELFLGLGAMITALATMGLVLLAGEVQGMRLGYLLTSVGVLLILLHGFPALKRHRLFSK